MLCCVVLSCFSRVRLFATPWTVAHQAPLSIGFSRQEYWSGLPFPSPGALPNPGIKPRSPALAGRFFTTSATWEVPSKQYSGLISFRIDGLISDCQESFPTPQFKSINSLIAFFMVQFSHPYMTTKKTTALTIWPFVGRVMMSLLFNMLSRFVMTFLPRSKYLLISWL